MRYEGSKEHIEIHWWNMGKKTKEYSGPIDGYLEKRNITVRKLAKKGNRPERFKFVISTSSEVVIFTTYERHFRIAAEDAIKLFLTMMGDKATTSGWRFHRINWR